MTPTNQINNNGSIKTLHILHILQILHLGCI